MKNKIKKTLQQPVLQLLLKGNSVRLVSQAKLFAAAKQNDKPKSNSKKHVGQAKKTASNTANTATTSTASTNTNTTDKTSSKKTTKSTKNSINAFHDKIIIKCSTGFIF